MSRPEILYFIEHVARELDIACAVRHLARERHDVDVRVASLVFDRHEAVAQCQPQLITVPFFYSQADFGIRDLLLGRPGVPFVNLAFEQLLSKVTRVLKRPKDDISRKHVLHVGAGQFFGSFLQQYGVSPDNIAIAGSLPCALYREPYRHFFSGKREQFAAQYGLDPDKPWIFFPENFGAAFFEESTIAHRVRLGCDPAEVRAYRDYARAAFREIMPWCRKAARLGTAEIIIRPRPATAREAFIGAYREVAGDVPPRNLHFIKEDSIREWILASDVIVSSYSTSLVEAAVAGKPVAMLVPHAFPECVRTDWCDLPLHVTTAEQFLQLARSADQVTVSKSLINWANANLLPVGDPIAALADLLAGICKGHRAVPTAPPALPLPVRMREAVKNVGKPFEQLYRSVVPKKNLARASFYETDHFTQDEVDRRTESWAELLADTVQREAA